MATVVDRPITSTVENVAVSDRIISQVSTKMTRNINGISVAADNARFAL